jgi:hypothetical protein
MEKLKALTPLGLDSEPTILQSVADRYTDYYYYYYYYYYYCYYYYYFCGVTLRRLVLGPQNGPILLPPEREQHW